MVRKTQKAVPFRTWLLETPIYRQPFRLFHGPTSDVRAYCKRNYQGKSSEEWPDVNHGAAVGYVTVKQGRLRCWLIWVGDSPRTDAELIYSICHETCHLARHILRTAGVPLSKHVEELAYLQEALFRMCWKKVGRD
jgi:hypothetical protein